VWHKRNVANRFAANSMADDDTHGNIFAGKEGHVDTWTQLRALIAAARTKEDLDTLKSGRIRRAAGRIAARATRRRISLTLDQGRLVAFFPDTGKEITG